MKGFRNILSGFVLIAIGVSMTSALAVQHSWMQDRDRDGYHDRDDRVQSEAYRESYQRGLVRRSVFRAAALPFQALADRARPK